MGSSQSSPTTTVNPATATGSNSTSDQPTQSTSLEASFTKTTAITPTKPKRTGMDLVNHKCRKKKAANDTCVSSWYRERFLAGKSINQEEDCGELFETYKHCYLKHLKREFFDKGDKKPKDGSILAEELGDEQ